MNINYESLIFPIIVMFVILLIVAFLIPKLIKLTIVVMAVYLLFNIGYIWTSQETMTVLHADKWMNDESQEKFEAMYDDFYKKREENPGIVDVNKVKEMMDTTIQAAKQDASEVTDEEKASMKKYWGLIFESLTSEEARKLAESTKESWSKVFTKEEMNQIVSETTK
ncbi:hypothetical protein ABD91_20445 [Lysinibacillus sphaericus]|uniref:hypothetical protein n=1 Tax=Lysinibacillus sphaericus TaxID=1421 RepID=UPI0018CD6461|nr:hypothetical protein [Lysinibacillus sphaericus]MBG9693118.1 hypothetical protein [Lysinibacillus sphaericus]